MPLPSILPHQLSVYCPLAPCHQRRQGGLLKTWSPNLQGLCTFTITAHPHLLASTLNSHLVHASDADQAEATLTRWGPDGVGKVGGQFSSSLALFSFFHHYYFTVAARGNVRLSTTNGMRDRPWNSFIVWGGSLASHPEQQLEDEPAQKPRITAPYLCLKGLSLLPSQRGEGCIG